MKYQIPLYALTLLLSAFLLFSVQPMVGKYLLPLLGGGPSVWNTAMLFFQLLLLGGYAYAHAMAHFLKPKTQVFIHAAVFLLAALSLPLTLPDGANPTGHDPLMWQLGTMILMAAGPFFILSSTAPLLQQWFAKSSHSKAENPYFLYVASNAGSMLALLSYPVIIEPMLRLQDQSMAWSWGYGALALLLVTCGLTSKFPQIPLQPNTTPETITDEETITWKRRGTWLLLAFVPSSLMLGVTTFITTDIITVPLFWVIPLALYLLSFIIAFSEKPFFTLPLTRILQAMTALFLLALTIVEGMLAVINAAFLHLLFFFFTALMCHQELAALKPKAKHLTEFFLIMSFGGALGGIFNSLLAPLIFPLPYEYMIAIVLGLFCRYLSDPEQRAWPGKALLSQLDWKVALTLVLALVASVLDHPGVALVCGLAVPVLCFPYLKQRWIFGGLFFAVLLMNPLISWQSLSKSLTIARNYYGVILVSDQDDIRYMTHGITNHGGQGLDPDKKFKQFAYYHDESGIGNAFKIPYMKKAGLQEIAIIGLGTGSTACYYKAKNRHFDYFEIDPDIIRIAEDPRYFTYLSDCGINYTMHQGDGRLVISTMPDKKYDLINADAFTSDNIPLHIITKEAIEIYLKKLKPDGLLVFHISNRFFILDKELGAVAKSLNLHAISKFNVPKNNQDGKKTRVIKYASRYVILTHNETIVRDLKKIDPEWKDIEPPETMQPWTDDYANILRALIIK